MERMLFGTNYVPYYLQYYQQISLGDSVGLYNYESGKFHGIFLSVSKCEENIEPNAWINTTHKGSKYPYQIRVTINESYEGTLSADDLLKAGVKLHDSRNPRIGLIPPPIISSDQENKLCKLIIGRYPELIEKEKVIKETWNKGIAYIFKCSKATGGKVFHENIMGAPIKLFKPVVRHIQSGDLIFVWLIDGSKNQKLFGLWQAKARGQYDPSAYFAFGERYPAVVYCDRSKVWEKGISETVVRGIVPFDGSMPKEYRISYEQGQKLINELRKTNSEIDTTPYEKLDKVITLDRHSVDSGAEARIDDWLFSNSIVHVPGKELPFPGVDRKCDFYLPRYDVYIEYWGLAGQENYDRAMKDKLHLYDKHRLNLVQIYPKHMKYLPEILPKLLTDRGVIISKDVTELTQPSAELQSYPKDSTKFKEPVIPSPYIHHGRIFEYNVFNAKAKLAINKIGTFTILKDSTAVREDKASIPENAKRKRRELYQSGVLVDDKMKGLFRFTRDVDFLSPSAASGVISASSTNGWICFKLGDGRTLKDICHSK